MTALTPGTPVRLVRGEELLLGEVVDLTGTVFAIDPAWKLGVKTALGTETIPALEAAGWLVSPVEPPTPSIEIPNTPGIFYDRFNMIWSLDDEGGWMRGDEAITSDAQIRHNAPFTRLASRGVWQTEIVEEIATALESKANSSILSVKLAVNFIRREFGSVVGE